MTSARFCEACGAPLVAGARFCESCGEALAQISVAPAAGSASAPAPAPGSPPSRAQPATPAAPASARDHPASPMRAAIFALGVLAAALALGMWWQARAPQPPVEAPPAPAPSVSAATPFTAQPPPPAAAAVIDATRLEELKQAVIEANRAHTQAIFGSDARAADLRRALEASIAELGRALYQARVVQAGGDPDAAREEMRTFLEGLDEGGLGLSPEAVESGVMAVVP